MRLKLVPSLLAVVASSSLLNAADTQIVGPRSLGMGGATTASTNDNTASYNNPAMFGFFSYNVAEGNESLNNDYVGSKDFGVGPDFTFSYKITGSMSEQLQKASDMVKDGELTDIDTGDFSTMTPAQVKTQLDMIVKATSLLAGLDNEKNAIILGLNGGLGVRIGSMYVGGRISMDAAVQVIDVDTVNLGIDLANMDALATELAISNSKASLTSDMLVTLVNAGFANGQDFGGSPINTDADRDALIAYINSNTVENSLAAVTDSGDGSLTGLDAIIQEQIDLGNINEEDLDNLITTLGLVAGGIASGGDIADNTTAVLIKGFGLAEIPVTYGKAINDNLSIGVTAKYMLGRVYGAQIRVFDEDNDEFTEDLTDNFTESSTFGVDVGVLYRTNAFQFGLVGHNLNSPSFEGATFNKGAVDEFTVSDIEIEPHIQAGAAWIPGSMLTVEVDYDLTENKSYAGAYKTRVLRAGVEADLLDILAVRAGASKNTAEDDEPYVLSAGLGFNLGPVKLDLAGSMGLDTMTFDGQDAPNQGSASLSLYINW